MAASDRFAHGGVIAVGALAIVLVSSCGQITGLSDDYRYDLAEAGAEGDGSATAEGGPRDAGNACDLTERSRAQRTISEAGGETVSQQCRTCMASSCCDRIAECAQSDDCMQAMKCIFNCQKTGGGGGGGKNQCLANCRGTFTTIVGSCVEQECAAPTCQLQ